MVCFTPTVKHIEINTETVNSGRSVVCQVLTIVVSSAISSEQWPKVAAGCLMGRPG